MALAHRELFICQGFIILWSLSMNKFLHGKIFISSDDHCEWGGLGNILCDTFYEKMMNQLQVNDNFTSSTNKKAGDFTFLKLYYITISYEYSDKWRINKSKMLCKDENWWLISRNKAN